MTTVAIHAWFLIIDMTTAMAVVGDQLLQKQYKVNPVLLYNKVSRDVTKYQDRTNLSSTEFSLVIKNYTESNLNINYT
jgi:hypothetical protein